MSPVQVASRETVDATARHDDLVRLRDRLALAIHRETERDVDVANDRLDLRIRAAVMTILDEEVDDRRRWLRSAQERDEERARQAEEGRQ